MNIHIYDLTQLLGLCSTNESYIKSLNACGFDLSEMTINEYWAHLFNRSNGLEVSLEDMAMSFPDEFKKISGIWIIKAIFINGPKVKGFNSYNHDLPLGIAWGDERKKLKSSLGVPNKSGGGNRGPGGILWPLWDEYSIENKYILRAEYDEERKLRSLILSEINPK